MFDESEERRWSEGPVWQGVCTYMHTIIRHKWKDINVLGHMYVFVLLCFYVSACLVFMHLCVFDREKERGSSCRNQGAPGL